MKPTTAPLRPWAPHSTRRALRGRVIVKLRPDVDPAHIFQHTDVQLGAALAANRVDGGGAVDRVLHHFSPRMQVTRLHASARNCCVAGRRHLDWDDLEVELGLSRTFRIELDPASPVLDVVDSLCSLQAVESASPHYLSETPFADGSPGSSIRPAANYGQLMVGSRKALEQEPGDSALIVAIIDSGVAMGHPELEGKLRPGSDVVDMPSGELADGIHWIGDTEGRDKVPADEVGHGTACAGIIGANGWHTEPGLSGAARLLPIRALAGAEIDGRKQRTALGTVPDLDAGLKLAVDLSAKVINLSFGTPGPSLRAGDRPPHEEVVQYAIARGCVLVAASGNSGGTTTYYPAALPGVIAVGSVGPQGAVSSFTSRGEHVALCAPGEQIYAPNLHGGYARNTGTSFAAPFVTGACALLAARCARQSTPVSPELIRRALVESAAAFPSEPPEGSGAGILDLPAALRWLDRVLERSDQVSATATLSPQPPERASAP